MLFLPFMLSLIEMDGGDITAIGAFATLLLFSPINVHLPEVILLISPTL